MDRVPSLSAVIWLTAVWVFLWGDLSWGNVVNGVLLACFVHIMFPMPTVARTVPGVRPLAVVILVARFLYDVVVSSVIVAKVALRKRPPQAAVIKVQLRSHNDMVLATVSGLTTLIPGSVVIEAHRLTGVIYIHVFDVPPRKPSAYLDGFRRTVLAQEERVMRAFSSDAELMDAGYIPGWRPGKGELPRAGQSVGSRPVRKRPADVPAGRKPQHEQPAGGSSPRKPQSERPADAAPRTQQRERKEPGA